MGLTREIGEFAAGLRFADVPAPAMGVVHTAFTDCIGVMLGGMNEPVTAIVYEKVASEGRDDAYFLGIAAAAPDLALLYGTAAHALDYDDVALSGHPSAVLVAAILAEANEQQADGAAMIAAYVAGYEAWGELVRRDADQHHRKGWHPTAMFGTVAAAAAAANLRGVDADTATHAVGIAASLAGGVVSNFGSMVKPFQVGRAAQAGLQAVRWAESGLTAGPEALEHDLGLLKAISPGGIVDTRAPAELGRRWRILDTGVNVKLYPVCYAAHRTLDAVIDLRRAHGFAAADVAQVTAEVSETQASLLRFNAPVTPTDSKFSLQFAVAAGVVAGRCGNAEMTDEFLQRPEVRELFGKVKALPNTTRDPDEPGLAAFDRVSIALKDGRTLVSDPVQRPRGHFRREPEPDALAAKFRDCAAAVLAPDAAERLFARLQDLRSLRSVAELAAAAKPEAVVRRVG
jgi:2-methylcitrate dehydratase PrpD